MPRVSFGETIQLIEAVQEVWSPKSLTTRIIPIGIGLAVPFAWREPLLRVMPGGFVSVLGRFGLAFSEAMMGTAIAIGSKYVLPENWKQAGYLAASAGLALAGYDAIKALIGGSPRAVGQTSGVRRVETHSETPGQLVSPVARGYQPYQGKIMEFR